MDAQKQQPLKSGITTERSYTVTPETTAAALAARDGGKDIALPAVWSTPDMIARMEMVAANLAAAQLDAAHMTVGARNEISHFAPTPVGAQVRVIAELANVDGRKLTFKVTAHDEREKVGEGVHIRYVVERAKFDQKLREKALS